MKPTKKFPKLTKMLREAAAKTRKPLTAQQKVNVVVCLLMLATELRGILES